jgi:lipopolysaccharide-induced tumor necrosis factor-alpha factor
MATFANLNPGLQVTTTTMYESSAGTWLIALVVCLAGCWLGCCLIPFCVDAMKTARHFCPICQSALGEKKFLF